MLKSVVGNWNLIVQMTRREVVGRYRGSFMGLAWSFFNPLFMLLVYTFVFSVLFKARWQGQATDNRAEFAIILFVGLILHGLIGECINRAPILILGNANYVKKVVFPLEILPVVAFGSALFHAVVSLIVLFVAELAILHHIPWTTVYFPLVALPLVFFSLGATWLLAALGVYMRDISQFSNILVTVLMFLSPIFYPVSLVPEQFRFIYRLNPLTFVIQESRDVLLFGVSPHWAGLGAQCVVAVAIAWLGFYCFQRSRTGFADVL